MHEANPNLYVALEEFQVVNISAHLSIIQPHQFQTNLLHAGNTNTHFKPPLSITARI